MSVSTPVIHPTWVDRDHGWVVHLVEPALADATIDPWLRSRLGISLARTNRVLGDFVSSHS